MAYIATYEGKDYTIDLKKLSDSVYEVVIKDENTEKRLVLDVRRHGCCVFSVLCDGKSFEVDVDERDTHLYDVLVEGEHFEIKVMDEMKKKLEKLLGAEGLEEGEIKTSMPGKVTKVFVKEGDAVKKGDPVVVLEAMKMENEFKAPKDGVVKALKVKEGDTVNAGAVLAIIE